MVPGCSPEAGFDTHSGWEAGWTGQLWSYQEDVSRSDYLIPNPGEYLSGLALYLYIVMRNWGP